MDLGCGFMPRMRKTIAMNQLTDAYVRQHAAMS